MRKFFLSLVFTALAFSLFSQNADITAIVNSNLSEEAKIHKLNGLATQFIENKQLNEAEKATEAISEVAQKSSLEFGKAIALENLGLIAQGRFDYKNAMTYFVSALKIRDAGSDKSGVAAVKSLIGKVFALQNDLDNALTNYNAAMALLTENPKDLPIAASIHRNLGDLYLQQKLYGKATAAFDEALRIWGEDLGENKKAADVAVFLGKVVGDMGDNDGALTYFTAAMNFHRNLNDVEGIGHDLVNMARIHNALDDRELALEESNQAILAFQEAQNKIGEAEATVLLSNITAQMSNKMQAAILLEKAGELLRGVEVQPGIHEIYKNIAKGFENLGDFAKAYAYANAYSVAKDALFNKEKASSLLELTTKYESEFAVKEKNRQLAEFASKQAQEMKIRWLLIGLVLVAFLAMFLGWRMYRIKKQDNETLRELNTQIGEQHNELIKKSAEINAQNELIRLSNEELQDKNASLDKLNERLVEEIAERENSQKTLFTKDHFLANVTSRMRHPLNEVVGLSQLLMNEKPRQDQREHLQSLQFAANNLLVLINDVLDFSKIEAGKLTLETVAFSPEDIVKDVKKEIKSSEKVKINFDIDKRLPEELNGDPVRLTQILTYLTRNMRSQIEEGNINVSVMRNELIDNELTIKIELSSDTKVKDFDRLDAIFNQHTSAEDFDDVSNSDMEFVVARRLVELQNGTISVQESHKGAVLTTFLPYALIEKEQNNDAKATKATEQNVNADNIFEAKKVLIVEDNKVNQLLVTGMLRKRGCIVTTANDGIEGLEAVEKEHFDIVLMDIQMPRMDGYRAVAEIRRMKDAEKAAMPIIALTASAYINEKEKAQLFGMTDHIGKPFAPEELLGKVARILSAAKNGDNLSVAPQAAAGA